MYRNLRHFPRSLENLRNLQPKLRSPPPPPPNPISNKLARRFALVVSGALHAAGILPFAWGRLTNALPRAEGKACFTGDYTPECTCAMPMPCHGAVALANWAIRQSPTVGLWWPVWQEDVRP